MSKVEEMSLQGRVPFGAPEEVSALKSKVNELVRAINKLSDLVEKAEAPKTKKAASKKVSKKAE